MSSTISNADLRREGKPIDVTEKHECRDFGTNNEREAREHSGMRAKVFLRHVRKRILRGGRKFLSCFKPREHPRSYGEIKESHRLNEGAASNSVSPENVRKPESLIKEVAVEGQPPDTIIAAEVSSMPTDVNYGRQVIPQSHDESSHLSDASRMPMPHPQTNDTTSDSSSYSFFKDDIPRRMKSSPPVEKPSIKVVTGTVASLRKTLSEHHTLKSYEFESTDNEKCSNGKDVQLFEVNGTPERDNSSGTREDNSRQEERVREYISDSREAASQTHTELRDLNQESLLQTPVGYSSSESSLRDFITPSSSTQDSSIIPDEGITEKSLAVSDPSNSTFGSRSQDNDRSFHSESANVTDDSSNGAMDKGMGNMGMVAEGIEEIRVGVKAGTRWLYQTLCSLLSNEDEKDEGLIVL